MMNLTRKYFLIIVILGFLTKTFGQDIKGPISLSITEAQEYAIQNNRNVQAAKIDIEVADKQIREAIGIGLPQLSLAANYQHQFVIPQISFGSYLDPNTLPDNTFLMKNDIKNAFQESPSIPLGVKNNTTFDFTLSQLIFSGEYIVGLQAFKVLRQVSEKALAKTEGETKESVADTYYLILVLGESIKVLQESLGSMEQTYSEMVKMNQQGFNEDTDVDQLKLNLANLKRLITAVEAQQETSVKLLKYQMGMDFNQPLVLKDSIQQFISDGNMQYLMSPVFNLDRSVDYQIVKDQVDLSSLNLKREQSAWLPSVSGFYRRHEQTNQPSFNFAVKDLVGVSLNFPIFTSGERSSRISQARFNLEKSQVTRDNAGQGLILEFETALRAYQTAYRNFITSKEGIMLSKKVYDKTLIKYHEGVSTSFELSQNQTQYLTSESNYYNSILTLLNAKAKLDRILESN